MVSIHCLAYNHEQYIADAMDSFLKQKTNFKFEILIHDDASTDRTADIIREYEKKYPNLIKPIYQTENQYSKGVSVDQANTTRAKGKYIAICEGDDYWLDPYKLQKQFDYMEKHPECSLCVHGGNVVNASDKKCVSINRLNKGDKEFSVEEVIEGGGGLFLTNSMFYPLKFRKERPDFLINAPVGDYPLVIYLSLLGTVYYMDELMSSYRVGDSTSWTGRTFSDIETKKQHYLEIEDMLNEINLYTNNKFKDAINRRKKSTLFSLLLEEGRLKEAKTGEYRELYLNLGLKKKAILFIDQYSPSISKLLRFVKRRIINGR
ncbi:glycosyltransferase family 2 protein [Lysinibacillus sp. CNPSo 3705]|uniref:glycosyltransferase family 2 protein n=1 Tax=Lysinibacillus sp. CNPSo 3705 TaxID=3028148 RepID=UPI002363E0AC|nr:glycosyltransferase family 2 protein [Lysinibacillus sp. CNPSo 3705]MDD1501309.1 glycosyltransferase family 2 protein [Lysinibacillus sp. CNPSo 3705]